MKAKRRAITSTGGPPGRARTPTNRRVRPAIAGRAVDAGRRRRPSAPRTDRRAPGRRSPRTPPSTCRSISARACVLANPILVASGTFGYGIEYGEVVDVDRLGAICCKGTTLKPRIGNPPPRVTETPAGMLNSIGLQNPGVDAVIEKYAATLGGLAGAGHRQRRRRVGRGLRRGRAPARRRARRGRHRAQHQLPERGQGRAPVRARCGRGRRGDRRRPARHGPAAAGQAVARTSPTSGHREGHRGCRRGRPDRDQHAVRDGPRTGPDASRCWATSTAGCPVRRSSRSRCAIVYEVAQVVDIPIVAIGGVTELDDVLDFLAVGAVAVQVGTAIFADPTLPVRLIDELAAGCRERGLASYRDLIGTALPSQAGAPVRRRASSTGPDRPGAAWQPLAPDIIRTPTRRPITARPDVTTTRPRPSMAVLSASLVVILFASACAGGGGGVGGAASPTPSPTAGGGASSSGPSASAPASGAPTSPGASSGEGTGSSGSRTPPDDACSVITVNRHQGTVRRGSRAGRERRRR